MKRDHALLIAAAVLLASWCVAAQPPAHARAHLPGFTHYRMNCDWWSTLCADVWSHKNYEGYYTGHDEPSVGFYSTTPGSGNNTTYLVTLPQEPATPVVQNGSGGTDDFQLRPAFQFTMTLCDTESAPEYTHTCVPDTDRNIYESPDPASSHYIGHHPGAAVLELQFYPPGWADSSCDSALWCVALTIDSYNFSFQTGQDNNPACLDLIGDEPINFAYLTQNGIPLFPPNPLRAPFGVSIFDVNQLLLMNPGDSLVVSIKDTPSGLKVEIHDFTTGQTGSMAASPTNGFGQVIYNPAGSSCAVRPYAFHPMYSTSTVKTRIPWAAHSVNVSFTDEIGHFEYCSAVNSKGDCIAGVNHPHGPDFDDTPCLIPGSPSFPPYPFVQVGGCVGEDLDFDGVPYGLNWPGTDPNHFFDAAVHPTPILFTSPVFRATGQSAFQNYSSVGF